MKDKTFTETAWLKELQRAATKLPDRDGFLTTREMCKATKQSEQTILRKLVEKKDEGRLVTATVNIEAVNGQRRTVVAYKIAPKKKP